MAYSQGGLIAASDYNNFLNGSNQLNTVWSTGTGDTGYGQTALSTVATSGTVTATQWATLINTLNNALTHQQGSGSGLGAPTTGATIAYLSSLSGSINTAYTNTYITISLLLFFSNMFNFSRHIHMYIMNLPRLYTSVVPHSKVVLESASTEQKK